MNVPLQEWVKRNKRMRETSSNEDDIPLDELAKRMKMRHDREAEMEISQIRLHHNNAFQQELNNLRQVRDLQRAGRHT